MLRESHAFVKNAGEIPAEINVRLCYLISRTINLAERQIPMDYPRASGILLHPTSLPGGYGLGDLSEWAYHFVDFLVESEQSLWQMLPLGPTSYGDSPYQSLSSFAGNPLLISLDKLVDEGWLTVDDLA